MRTPPFAIIVAVDSVGEQTIFPAANRTEEIDMINKLRKANMYFWVFVLDSDAWSIKTRNWYLGVAGDKP